MFDLFDISEKIIEWRMALHFRFGPRDQKDAKKYFLIGHPRTGTTSTHQFFLSCGLTSIHQAADWNTKIADSFTDKGQNRPFEAYDTYYENADFILNCRPVQKYLLSLEHVFARDFSARTFEREIMRRSAHFDRVLRYFRGRVNLLVVNIEKPGAMKFIGQRLGLHPASGSAEKIHNKARHAPSPANVTNIAKALENLRISGKEPLLSAELSDLNSFVALEKMTKDGRTHI